jgi:uncharacterized protein (DUF433 family)
MPTLTAPHIWLDENGVARVDHTGHKVRMIALDVIARGWSPNEIHENYPDLSLAQIHAALTYYYDNKARFDAEIAEGEKLVEKMRAESESLPATQELLARIRHHRGE